MTIVLNRVCFAFCNSWFAYEARGYSSMAQCIFVLNRRNQFSMNEACIIVYISKWTIIQWFYLFWYVISVEFLSKLNGRRRRSELDKVSKCRWRWIIKNKSVYKIFMMFSGVVDFISCRAWNLIGQTFLSIS